MSSRGGSCAGRAPALARAGLKPFWVQERLRVLGEGIQSHRRKPRAPVVPSGCPLIVSIHQPHYLPWLRYFDKIARSDLFIFLDDADFNKNGWQNRNRLKGPTGPQILTIPVQHRLGQRLEEVSLAPGHPWAHKHLKTIRQFYARAPHLADFLPDLEDFYTRPWCRLVDLAWETIRWHMAVLGIATPMVRSSELGVAGRASARLVNLVRAVGGTAYLTGAHGLQSYLEPARFQEAGLDLLVHQWSCPEYAQVWPQVGFTPDLATLDLLLAEGPRSGEVLSSGGRVVQPGISLENAR